MTVTSYYICYIISSLFYIPLNPISFLRYVSKVVSIIVCVERYLFDLIENNIAQFVRN